MSVCDLGVNDQFCGLILQSLFRVFEFTAVDPLSVDKFPYLCDDLAGPF